MALWLLPAASLLGYEIPSNYKHMAQNKQKDTRYNVDKSSKNQNAHIKISPLGRKIIKQNIRTQKKEETARH